MSDSVWKQLIDVFQNQDDAHKKRTRQEFLKSDQCVVDPSSRLDSWKIIIGENLPSRTLCVSRDVFDALKRACDIGQEKP